jgi:hypothetical protein
VAAAARANFLVNRAATRPSCTFGHCDNAESDGSKDHRGALLAFCLCLCCSLVATCSCVQLKAQNSNNKINQEIRKVMQQTSHKVSEICPGPPSGLSSPLSGSSGEYALSGSVGNFCMKQSCVAVVMPSLSGCKKELALLLCSLRSVQHSNNEVVKTIRSISLRSATDGLQGWHRLCGSAGLPAHPTPSHTQAPHSIYVNVVQMIGAHANCTACGVIQKNAQLADHWCLCRHLKPTKLVWRIGQRFHGLKQRSRNVFMPKI